MEVRYSDYTVEIFYQNKRVAVHNRFYQPGYFSTQEDHMASAHKVYAEWTPSRMINWSKNYGKYTQELIKAILDSRPHPEQGFRSCMGILNHARDIDSAIVEQVSKKMIGLHTYTATSFKSILKNKTYTKQKPTVAITPDSHHINVRGEEYYTGGTHG